MENEQHGSEQHESDEYFKVRFLAVDLGCGAPLARDLLTLAGGDDGLVRRASMLCKGAESMKAYILDHRIKQVEDMLDRCD